VVREKGKKMQFMVRFLPKHLSIKAGRERVSFFSPITQKKTVPFSVLVLPCDT